MAEEYGDRVVFIGVSNQDTIDDGRAYQERYGVPYALANSPDVWQLYGDPFRPTTIVITPEGVEDVRIDGPITKERLRAELDRVLA